MSPCFSSMTSPGTSSRAGGVTRFPSRFTRVLVASLPFKVAMALPAERSSSLGSVLSCFPGLEGPLPSGLLADSDEALEAVDPAGTETDWNRLHRAYQVPIARLCTNTLRTVRQRTDPLTDVGYCGAMTPATYSRL